MRRNTLERRIRRLRARFVPGRGTGGFTLLELLVVIATIAILAALMLPALRAAKEQAQGIQCLSQLKQFSYAWNLYADDYEEQIPPNYGRAGPAQIETNTWVQGWLDDGFFVNWPDNTNTIYLTVSLVAPYLARSIAIWRCPGDKSTAPYSGFQGQLPFRLPRVRSYSMNSFLNAEDPLGPIRWKIILQRPDMISPGPAMTFVFVDEREDTIQDASFLVDMWNQPPFLPSSPRSSHHGAGTLSFADGHAELKRWLDPITRLPVRQQTFFRPNPDITWLQERTTGRK